MIAVLVAATAFTPPTPVLVERFAVAMAVSTSVPSAMAPHVIISAPAALVAADSFSSAIDLAPATAFLTNFGFLYVLVAILLVANDHELRVKTTERIFGAGAKGDTQDLQARLVFAERRARAAAAIIAEEDASWSSPWEAVETACATDDGCTVVRACHHPNARTDAYATSLMS